MRHHMLPGRTSTMSSTCDTLPLHGDHFRWGKPLIRRISRSRWSQYVNHFPWAQCSGFAAIGCLGIRLGPVSFHARDDNNGRCCLDDCWHHYSCVLPHASIFTCCTDAPEVNEFFTLGFRPGSRRQHTLGWERSTAGKPKDFPFFFFFHGIRLLSGFA